MAFTKEKDLRGLEASTFDIVRVETFHNTRFWTVCSYLYYWVVLLLQVAILGFDGYTCVNILAFDKWSSTDYKPYEYRVAKWIFTGCILFRVGLLLYKTAWGIHTYRTRNIALAYLNDMAKLFYVVRSFDYHCLFHEIEHEGFFNWACFLVYTELDSALEVMVADMPRQVVNFLTLRYYATAEGTNNAIVTNIRAIATNNVRLAVILSFQLATIAIFLFFFFKFVLGMLLFIYVRVKVSHRGFNLLKLYCYHVVNEKVRYLVSRHHKPRTQILDEGIMNAAELRANPLILSQSTLDLGAFNTKYEDAQGGRRLDSESRIGLHNQSALELADISSDSITKPYRAYTQEDKYDRNNPFADERSAEPTENPFADNLSSSPFVSTDQLARNYSKDSFAPLARKEPTLYSQDVFRYPYTAPGKTEPQRQRSDSYGSASDMASTHSMDAPATPLLEQRRDSVGSSHDSDNGGAPYPVRGVSVYGEL